MFDRSHVHPYFFCLCAVDRRNDVVHLHADVDNASIFGHPPQSGRQIDDEVVKD